MIEYFRPACLCEARAGRLKIDYLGNSVNFFDVPKYPIFILVPAWEAYH
jgi:hypothetical protein